MGKEDTNNTKKEWSNYTKLALNYRLVQSVTTTVVRKGSIHPQDLTVTNMNLTLETYTI